MGWVYAELVLVSVAAMLSPTTLSFCTLALVLGRRPLRTGLWFYAGALGATLAIGVVAAFVIGDVAASDTSSPKTWVAVVDIVAAVVIVVYLVYAVRRPPNPARTAAMVDRMSMIASSPVVAIVAAGATLANPGGFIPLALKEISETDPSTAQYVVEWLFFSLVSLLPLLVALVMLAISPDRTKRLLVGARTWLEKNIRTVAVVLLAVIAAVLIRNGIAGLAS
jgi:Sap, sulfolipid-1-addressing protein